MVSPPFFGDSFVHSAQLLCYIFTYNEFTHRQIVVDAILGFHSSLFEFFIPYFACLRFFDCRGSCPLRDVFFVGMYQGVKILD